MAGIKFTSGRYDDCFFTLLVYSGELKTRQLNRTVGGGGWGWQKAFLSCYSLLSIWVWSWLRFCWIILIINEPLNPSKAGVKWTTHSASKLTVWKIEKKMCDLSLLLVLWPFWIFANNMALKTTCHPEVFLKSILVCWKIQKSDHWKSVEKLKWWFQEIL